MNGYKKAYSLYAMRSVMAHKTNMNEWIQKSKCYKKCNNEEKKKHVQDYCS